MTRALSRPRANRLGIRHITFAVDDLDDVIERLQRKGFDTVGAVQNYEDILRLCLISRPEGIIVDELAEPNPSFRRTG